MKIFKFYKVDGETGISVAIQRSRGGPCWPNLPGLNAIFDFNGFNYAYVDDSAVAEPDNYIFEITEQEFGADIEAKTNQYLAEYKALVYPNEKALREQVFGKYDATASIAGVYKYEEALRLIQDDIPSADITAEATARGISEIELAEKIIENHEAFRLKDAQIAGLRGKMLDRLNMYTFDANDPLGSWTELVGRTEVVGHSQSGGPNPETTEVKSSYYYPDLGTRWAYLGT